LNDSDLALSGLVPGLLIVPWQSSKEGENPVGSKELARERLYEALAQKFEELISSGVYAPGDKLPPARVIAQKYGVSQTVVRDATHSLVGKGLLQVRHGVGIFVAQDSETVLIDAFRWSLRNRQVTQQEIEDLRMVLEIQIAALAARRRNEQDLVHIQDILREYESLAPVGPREQTAICHMHFHVAIIRATHNRVIFAILEPLIKLMISSVKIERPGEAAVLAYKQHEHLFGQILAGDEKAARVAMEEHYTSPWSLQFRQAPVGRQSIDDI
jgi:GntR family transcriptional repressor for pyruvate dehydrogenase complex